MTKRIEKFGQNVTYKNFFTSLPLAQNQLKKKLAIVETLKRDKIKLSLEFTVRKKREIKSTLFGFQDNATITLHFTKKNYVVRMLSTMHFRTSCLLRYICNIILIL